MDTVSCKFYVEHKQRFCKLPQAVQGFCVEHSHLAKDFGSQLASFFLVLYLSQLMYYANVFHTTMVASYFRQIEAVAIPNFKICADCGGQSHFLRSCKGASVKDFNITSFMLWGWTVQHFSVCWAIRIRSAKIHKKLNDGQLSIFCRTANSEDRHGLFCRFYLRVVGIVAEYTTAYTCSNLFVVFFCRIQKIVRRSAFYVRLIHISKSIICI